MRRKNLKVFIEKTEDLLVLMYFEHGGEWISNVRFHYHDRVESEK
jgi:hypothetical protein